MSGSAGRAATLPSPAKSRFQPMRLGLVDLYWFDEEEIPFRDGRLLLRGHNGTGKSKVLALTLPFLLEGDLSAHRVEPDADPSKRMEWNLLLGGRHEERTGYTWLELGRLGDDGEPEFVTLGCGLKAVAGRPVSRWFFVTDQRVGIDLELVAHRTALSRERLREALGDRGRLFDRGEDYRRAVDERLFRLGAERHAALISLLLQLRQPQLSKRPDEQRLSRALTEALPPIDEGTLADLATAFHELEAERLALEGFRQSRAAVEAFAERYALQARIAVLRRAAAVRVAHSAYEKTQRERREAERLFEESGRRIEEIGAGLQGLAEEEAACEARERALRDSEAMQDAKALEAAEEAARGAAARFERAAREQEEAATRLARAEEEAERGAERARVALAALDEAAASLRAAAEPAGLLERLEPRLAELEGAPPVEFEEGEELRRSRAARKACERLLEEREREIAQVEALLRAAAAAQASWAETRARRDEALSRRDSGAEALAKAQAEAARAAEELVATSRRHAAACVELELDAEEISAQVEEWTLGPDGPSPLRAALERAHERVVEVLVAEDERLARRAEETIAEREEAVLERRELETGAHRPPVGAPTRDREGRAGRDGAALWSLIEFDEGVEETERAGLEAALEASGLLDAWVTPEGGVLREGELDAAVLAGKPVQENLGAKLRPAGGELPVPAEVVSRVLAGIGLGADSAASWVDVSGRFRLGVSAGAWRKERAEHVGARAREASRRRRLRELDERLAELAARLEELEAARERLRERRLRAAAERDGAPPEGALLEARRFEQRATDELERLEESLAAEEERSALAGRRAETARAELARDAADLRLPVEEAALAAVRRALEPCRSALARLEPLRQRAGDAAAEAGRAAERRDETLLLLERRRDEQGEAKREAVRCESRRATLHESVGREVASLLAELDRVRREIDELAARRERAQEERADAREAHGEARARREDLTERLRDEDGRRSEAIEALRRLAERGLVEAAVPGLETPPPAEDWAPDPAVRLCRRLDQEMEGLDAGQPAWERVGRAVHERFQSLQAVLSEHGHRAELEPFEGLAVVSVSFRNESVTPGELAGRLAAEIEERERILTAREKQVIEEHLVSEIAQHLVELVLGAERFVDRVNAELERRPTGTGMRLRLRWIPHEEGPAGLSDARERLLRQATDAWSPEDREAVGRFLQSHLEAVRREDEAAPWHQHLRRALDYRQWHRFVVERKQDGRWRPAAGPASGGERVLAITLPLFAAAAAHVGDSPIAPRFVLLDEAFAGVDPEARRHCFALLASFDLDSVMTSESEWGCHAEVPGLAIAQLSRREGIDAVLVTRFEWDGRTRTASPSPAPA